MILNIYYNIQRQEKKTGEKNRKFPAGYDNAKITNIF